jgi:hypothetical protein
MPLAAAVLAATVAAHAAAPPLQQQGELRWACGGVGADERRALAAARGEANLEVVFVSAKRGGYLAGARLEIGRAAGAAPLLTVVAEGPVCHLAAPPGAYRLAARIGELERTRVVRVPAPGNAPARVVFAFPDEPWDGIRASEEEKRQAREP